MNHLSIQLFEHLDDSTPAHVLTADHPQFWDLGGINFSNKVQRVTLTPAEDYHVGDHIRLCDEARSDDTHTRSVDPAVTGEVNLNQLDFAKAASGVLFIPNPGDSFVTRVSLYPSVDEIDVPWLVFYDWELPRRALLNLNLYHFGYRTQVLRVEGEGSVTLFDRVDSQSSSLVLGPGLHYLKDYRWDNKAAALRFDLD